MKIGIYALAKNEAANAWRWEASCRDADYRVVTDTGSTDDTVVMLEAAGVTVASGAPIPWRWDDAHNLSLMHLPADVDVAIRLDLDEALDPGWREALEAAWKENTTKLRYPYWWSPDFSFRCDRIHSRHGYRWSGATHEGLVRWSGTDVQTFTDNVVIRHFREPGKKHKSDLELLTRAVEENPTDARMHWYYARELDYAGDSRAAAAFANYLKMPGGAPNERAYARRMLARLDEAGAKSHILAAMLEAPNEPEPYLYVSQMGWGKRDPVAALYWARQAFHCDKENCTHSSDPAAYGDLSADLAYSAAYELGLYDEALTYAREAARRNPGEPRHAANIRALETMKSEAGPKP
jgi:tetratricopeptide (TPR) repeat protein